MTTDPAKKDFEQQCADVQTNGICGGCMRTLFRGSCPACDSPNGKPKRARRKRSVDPLAAFFRRDSR